MMEEGKLHRPWEWLCRWQAWRTHQGCCFHKVWKTAPKLLVDCLVLVENPANTMILYKKFLLSSIIWRAGQTGGVVRCTDSQSCCGRRSWALVMSKPFTDHHQCLAHTLACYWRDVSCMDISFAEVWKYGTALKSNSHFEERNGY